MKLTAQSEWMLDQRQAVVMAPGKAFEAIQTSSGSSVFFSIGTDHILYACRELPAGSTGWTRVNLSGAIQGKDGKKPAAKSFAVAQNPQSLYFDLALVVTVDDSDHLYLCSGHLNTDEAWSQEIEWKEIPFDGRSGVEIDNVYLMSLPSPGKPAGSMVCFVDILRGSKETNTLRLLDRYYIDPDSKPSWKKHTLAIDLAAGSITSSLGRRSKDRVAGIYTLGKIESKTQLIFAPVYDYWDENNAPPVARPELPNEATSMASAVNSSGYTHLFVSGVEGIFYYPPTNQKDGSKGAKIITEALVASATYITAEINGGITALYGLSKEGDLFYTTCKTGSESTEAAWSHPMPLVSKVQDYAFFLNHKAGDNTVFAHVKNEQLTQLVQDSVTRDWNSRNILLPSTDMQDVVTMGSFNTRLACRDDNNIGIPQVEVNLTATSPIGVYINDSYSTLVPGNALKVATDARGIINIYQPTHDMTAVCYKASLVKESGVSIDINPGAKVKDRLSNIKSADDLKNAKITNSDGTTQSLLPQNVSQEDLQAAVGSIKDLVKIYSSLPEDGSLQKTAPKAALSFIDGEQADEVSGVNDEQMPVEAGGSSIGDIFVAAGDLFRSILHTTWNAVKDWAIRVVDGVSHFFVTIGDAVYRAALNCVSAVTHAFEWVFDKIKVGWEKLKAFLGFVFNWGDIVRTHKVIKNVTEKYSEYVISRIDTIQNYITSGLDSLESKINAWAEIPDHDMTISQIAKSADSTASAHDDPQTHYVQDKVKENLDKAKEDLKSLKWGELDEWKDVIMELEDLAEKQQKSVLDAIDQLRKEIIDQFGNLTPKTVVTRLLAIIGHLGLETVKNIVVKTMQFFKKVTNAVLEELSKPIDIPVVSYLYKQAADEELSILDVVCLVAAVPATLLYKVVTASTPFPDNESTKDLINAKDFAAIQKTLKSDAELYKTISVVSQFAAMAGLGFSVLINTFKIPQTTENKPTKVPEKIKQVSVPIKILVLMPEVLRPRDDNDPWEDKMNVVVTDIAFLKTCLDASSIGEKEIYGPVSPYIDFAISAVWIVPAVGKIVANHKKSSSYLSLTTNLAYDIAVMMGPIIWSPLLDPEDKLIVLVAADGLLAITAWVRVANAGVLQRGD